MAIGSGALALPAEKRADLRRMAAAWALERLPAEYRAEMALARHAYLDGGDDDWAQRMPQVEALPGFLRRAIEQCGDADN